MLAAIHRLFKVGRLAAYSALLACHHHSAWASSTCPARTAMISAPAHVGVRAEPFAPGADEWLALEVYLLGRAAGQQHEGVAVRP